MGNVCSKAIIVTIVIITAALICGGPPMNPQPNDAINFSNWDGQMQEKEEK